MITQQQIQDVLHSIIASYEPNKVILFGSMVNDNGANANDIDLILIKPTTLPKHLRSVELYKLFLKTQIPIDILVYTPNEYDDEIKNNFSFLYKALQNSKVLYEQ